MDHHRDAPSVAATRGESVGRVTRNHVLFGLAIVAVLLAALAMSRLP